MGDTEKGKRDRQRLREQGRVGECVREETEDGEGGGGERDRQTDRQRLREEGRVGECVRDETHRRTEERERERLRERERD